MIHFKLTLVIVPLVRQIVHGGTLVSVSLVGRSIDDGDLRRLSFLGGDGALMVGPALSLSWSPKH